MNGRLVVPVVVAAVGVFAVGAEVLGVWQAVGLAALGVGAVIPARAVWRLHARAARRDPYYFGA